MALRHKTYDVKESVQFHPESILTEYGDQIIQELDGVGAFEVGFTMCDVRCTIYDVRFTIYGVRFTNAD